MDSEIISHLDRSYGHEVAEEIAFYELTIPQIVEELTSDDVTREEVRRIVNPPDRDVDFIDDDDQSDETDEYTLDTKQFTDDEMDTMSQRAHARRIDRNSEITEDDYDGDLHTEHMDAPNCESEFRSHVDINI